MTPASARPATENLPSRPSMLLGPSFDAALILPALGAAPLMLVMRSISRVTAFLVAAVTVPGCRVVLFCGQLFETSPNLTSYMPAPDWSSARATPGANTAESPVRASAASRDDRRGREAEAGSLVRMVFAIMTHEPAGRFSEGTHMLGQGAISCTVKGLARDAPRRQRRNEHGPHPRRMGPVDTSRM